MSLRNLARPLLAVATGCVLFGAVHAAPQTFFVSGTTASIETERERFLAKTTGVVADGFETSPGGPIGATTLPVLGGLGSLTQGVGGRANVLQGAPANGRFNTTPGCDITIACKWLETSTTFTIRLNAVREAFGFFATDVGDAGGSITLDLWSGVNQVRSGIAVTQPGQIAGLLFFGYIDDAFKFDRITVNVTQTSANPVFFDGMGFDDVLAGNIAGTTPVSSPAPLGLALLGLGLLALTRRSVTSAQ
jgi:MYXO-CTERM domain-containing protein